jgi:hypothetical protein
MEIRRIKMPYQIYLRPAYPNELYHHGIKGQKWGIRRFQNPDGTLTAAGKKRYIKGDGKLTRKGNKAYKKDENLKKSIDIERDSSAKAKAMEDLGYENDYYKDSSRDAFVKDIDSNKYWDLHVESAYDGRSKQTPKEAMAAAKKLERKASSIARNAIDKLMKEEYEEFSKNTTDPNDNNRRLTYDEFKKALEDDYIIISSRPNSSGTGFINKLSIGAPMPHHGRIETGYGEFVFDLDEDGNIIGPATFND